MRETVTSRCVPILVLMLSLSIAGHALASGSYTGRPPRPPSSVDRATRASMSVPIESPSESSERHTATQAPDPSVAICGQRSFPASMAAFVFSGAGYSLSLNSE